MVCIALGAALVLPSRPDPGDLSLFWLRDADAIYGLKSFGIAHNERDTEAFPPLPAAAAHDAAAAAAHVRAEAVLLCLVAIIDIELGYKDAPIADILRLADSVALGILRLEVRFVAAASSARLTLLMSRDDIPDTIFLLEALRNQLCLTSAPIKILPTHDRRWNRRAVLHVLRLATSRHEAAQASHQERTLLVNPSLLFVLLVWISAVEVIGLPDDPVDRRLADSRAAALARGLSDDDLLRGAEAVHGHGLRCE